MLAGAREAVRVRPGPAEGDEPARPVGDALDAHLRPAQGSREGPQVQPGRVGLDGLPRPAVRAHPGLAPAAPDVVPRRAFAGPSTHRDHGRRSDRHAGGHGRHLLRLGQDRAAPSPRVRARRSRGDGACPQQECHHRGHHQPTSHPARPPVIEKRLDCDRVTEDGPHRRGMQARQAVSLRFGAKLKVPSQGRRLTASAGRRVWRPPTANASRA